MPQSTWNLPGTGIKPVFPALARGFLTTGPPGKSPSFLFSVFMFIHSPAPAAKIYTTCQAPSWLWGNRSEFVHRWFPASLERGEGPHPRGTALSQTLSRLADLMGKQKFLGAEQLRSGKKKKKPERLLGGIINVLLRRKILVCVSRNANTSANKTTQRKQVEPRGFSHKGLKNKREKK